MKQTLFYLKVSRPGLWFATIWLYLLPTSQHPELLSTIAFWYGLFYVTIPLNFLVYGWNDIVDREIDLLNPRKDSFWFGARGSQSQLQNLWIPILVVQIIAIAPIVYTSGLESLSIFFAFVIINGLYNLPKYGLRSRPPFELLCQIGYLLVVPLATTINGLESLSPQAFSYLLLFAMQSHLIGEVMDIYPDRASGRITTATKIGVYWTKWLIIGIVLSEIVLFTSYFDDLPFTIFLICALLWLVIDLTILYKQQQYTTRQMKLFAMASNVSGLVSILYVWWSGCLY